jgi:hypothetical protein
MTTIEMITENAWRQYRQNYDLARETPEGWLMSIDDAQEAMKLCYNDAASAYKKGFMYSHVDGSIRLFGWRVYMSQQVPKGKIHIIKKEFQN